MLNETFRMDDENWNKQFIALLTRKQKEGILKYAEKTDTIHIGWTKTSKGLSEELLKEVQNVQKVLTENLLSVKKKNLDIHQLKLLALQQYDETDDEVYSMIVNACNIAISKVSTELKGLKAATTFGVSIETRIQNFIEKCEKTITELSELYKCEALEEFN